ncbi:LysE family translocator [Paracidovorax cattleyae]|uniref:Threonine/homoserine/homoserine lactone efflux protein n=1 Tax=Paracidovorax cattleyae TaxID=80868 RepID=A0A1H0WRA3_9BURK|nr:LysE family transporter [Paracidovorax cattleyae]AVS74966.1 lysine transporter LysE [Paracidovorax cattleyae]MBF9266439.1 LysE family transporter [Paracidovorax cattleyae]SDP92806.1 Threonine/homoserine/homoserine lactone efflux protein [Paracidovorax cattleyae]
MDALLFAPVAVAIALTPGPNNFCGLNNGIRAGVGAAMFATIGRAAAFAIFLTISAVGLGAMLLASEAAFTTVKWVGAAYLFWLGWRAWNSREFGGLDLVEGGDAAAAPAHPAAVPTWRALATQEFLLGITNPKAIILFAAVFPQFIDPAQPAARQFVVLGSVYLLAEFVSTAVYASCGRQIRRVIRSQRGVVRLNKATGGFFMGAGGLLLAANR